MPPPSTSTSVVVGTVVFVMSITSTHSTTATGEM
jgi:hypothetical protein